ncbi:MAG: zinc ribbon domain-containing protein [Pseudomonadota bacterium]
MTSKPFTKTLYKLIFLYHFTFSDLSFIRLSPLSRKERQVLLMPIYEYEPLSPEASCDKCRMGLELIQRIDEPPLSVCPHCGKGVRKVISWCRAAVVETPGEHVRVNKKIGEYEKQGMWSHAAELADKHSEKVKDKGMKMRALENYKKAGYRIDSLERHAKDT